MDLGAPGEDGVLEVGGIQGGLVVRVGCGQPEHRPAALRLAGAVLIRAEEGHEVDRLLIRPRRVLDDPGIGLQRQEVGRGSGHKLLLDDRQDRRERGNDLQGLRGLPQAARLEARLGLRRFEGFIPHVARERVGHRGRDQCDHDDHKKHG